MNVVGDVSALFYTTSVWVLPGLLLRTPFLFGYAKPVPVDFVDLPHFGGRLGAVVPSGGAPSVRADHRSQAFPSEHLEQGRGSTQPSAMVAR